MKARSSVLLVKACALAVMAATVGVGASRASVAIGKPGITPAPCPDQAWEEADSTLTALPGAKVSFGHYEGGTYRIEIPDKWNGELVLWAHGYTANAGAQGSRLRVGVPGVGQGSPVRQHLVEKGFAWAASSYRCNGYVPGRGLLDTMALTGVFTKLNDGKAPSRVYLTGVSMGGHVTLLGLQEFPTSFAGGLALCPSGPGEMDFLTSVAAASEFITGVKVTEATRDQDVAQLTAILGKPPDYTDKGRQLASVQVLISGGPRPFAIEGLASRFTDNATTVADAKGREIWSRVASNSDVRYAIDEGLGLTADAINAGVRRKAADGEARSARGAYEEAIPFDGRIERPLITLHGSGDLYVPISLEQSLKQAVDAAGNRSLLVQRIIRSPGHCNFSAQEQVDAFDALVTWVRGGVTPQGDDVLADLTNAGMTFTNPLRPGDPGTIRVPATAR
jgi:pimeloyl-ACP methyl ester carboxylesterase